MRKIAGLLSAFVPVIALAQTAQTNCVNTPPLFSCTTTNSPPPPQVIAPDVAGAFLRGSEQALREKALRQQAELVAEQQRNLQLQDRLSQRELDQQQKTVVAEAAVVRQALIAFVEEQAKLPEAQRMHDQGAIGLRIAAIAHSMLGYEPSAEAFALAVNQLQATQVQ